MKVLLAVPSEDDVEFISSFLSVKADIYPHIGLAYVAAVAEQNGNEVKIVDNRIQTIKDIENTIKAFSPEVVGISATCFTIKSAIKIADLAKRINREIVVVVGGAIADIYPKEILGHGSIDVICLEESDYSFSELLKALEKNTSLKNVKGIVFKKNKKIIFSPPNQIIVDVDKIPFPARHLLERDKYYCALTKKSPVTTLISSRGCPFGCTYCLKYPHFRRTFRPRSPKNVVDEVEQCVNEGYKEIFFFDDTFSANIRRAKEICREIIKRRLDVFWDIRTRVDCMDKELLVLLKKAKCTRIHYGVEAGDPYILKTLEKGINLEQAKKIFKITKDIGIPTLAYFMLGVPRDTLETIKRTVDFAIELDPDYATFSPFFNLPHTKTYDYSLENRIIKNDIWRDYVSGKVKNLSPKSFYLLENVDLKTLKQVTDSAYRRFYFRPKKIFGIVKKIGGPNEFLRAADIGISMLRGK